MQGNQHIASRILNIETKWTQVVGFARRALYPQGKDPISTELETGWTPQPLTAFRKGSKPLSFAGNRTPNPLTLTPAD